MIVSFIIINQPYIIGLGRNPKSPPMAARSPRANALSFSSTHLYVRQEIVLSEIRN